MTYLTNTGVACEMTALHGRRVLAQDCADRCDKTEQHERHRHGDEHGQRAVGVLQEIKVYFAHSSLGINLPILTHCD